MPLWIAFGGMALTVPLLLLFHWQYELGEWADDALDHSAQWRERVRPWLLQHPRIVYILGIAWLLYAFFVVAMLAGAILLHHWFQMVLWGFLTLRIIATLLRRPYHPARVEQEQPAPPRPLLPITAADQEAVNELYQQRRKQRS